MWSVRAALATVLAISASGCATTGATLGSGVGDALIEHPPFYAGRDLRSLDAHLRIGLLPLAYQRGASQPELFDPAATDELSALLHDMGALLAARGAGVPLLDDVDGSTRSGPRLGGTPPDVRFGCPTESGQPDDDCADRGDGALGRGSQPMHLSVGRPSREWVAGLGPLMDEHGVDQVLLITVEVGQYWIRQRGFRGTKEVELGTDHTVRFPWLTSLEGPVAVIQLTGALLDREGKAIRIGAEGLMARRTSLTASALGAQRLVTDEEVRELRTSRRTELPGQPLVWEEGLRRLVEQLTGRKLEVRHAQ